MIKNNLMKNKGITLVALVITIIILLIFAGISIASLTGSGLFENARLAEQKSKNAQELEDSRLKDYENKISEYIDGTRNYNSIVYSEDEVEIGTWIDGKKVYRRVIDVTQSSNFTATQYELKNYAKNNNIASVLDSKLIRYGNADLVMPTYSVVSEGNLYYCPCFAFSSYSSEGAKHYLVIEYTKL